MPKFSVIIPHYQGVVPHDIFLRGINSLFSQTFKDFEILCYHEGPLLDTSVWFPTEVRVLPRRYNDWGHSVRDIGIRQAKGDYIIHTNADNLFYPHALETINAKDGNNIIIFPVRMMGAKFSQILRYDHPRNYNVYTDLYGYPATYNKIDCMQLVMKRKLWLKEGGWKNKSRASDGNMYPKFVKKYGCVYTSFFIPSDPIFMGKNRYNEILGEHY